MTVFTIVSPKIVAAVRLVAVHASKLPKPVQDIARVHGAITVKSLVLVDIKDLPHLEKTKAVYTLAGERIDAKTPIPAKPL